MGARRGLTISRYDPKSSVNGGEGSTRETTYTNDDFGRVLGVTNPDIGTWYSFYDQAGNLLTSQDGLGAKLYYTYDDLGRRTAVSSPTPADCVTFQYDQTGSIPDSSLSYAHTQGRLTSVLSADGGIDSYFTYDNLGRTVADVEGR